MSYDIIVCGGGTAGSVAAIAAARQDARILVIEQYGFLGGSQTAALVLPMMSFTTGGQQLVTGINQEIIDRCNALPGDNEVSSSTLSCSSMCSRRWRSKPGARFATTHSLAERR